MDNQFLLEGIKDNSPFAVPDDAIIHLQTVLIPNAQTSSDTTLQMTYLDPYNTSPWSIGSYFRDNITNRLTNTYGASSNAPIRALVKGKSFKLSVSSDDGITYEFPIYRCAPSNRVPGAGNALKKSVRSLQIRPRLLPTQPRGLFIGILFDDVRGVEEIFIGILRPMLRKSKYQTTVLNTIYLKSKDIALISGQRPPEDDISPQVSFRKK